MNLLEIFTGKQWGATQAKFNTSYTIFIEPALLCRCETLIIAKKTNALELVNNQARRPIRGIVKSPSIRECK